MTPSEIMSAKATFGQLWPHSRMTDMEWGVVAEKAWRIDITAEQATAALRNLKATADAPPGVAATLSALKAAEGPKVQRQAQPATNRERQAWGFRAAEMLNERGLTSFEQRVLDDPKFAAFAKKAGQLDADRLKEIKAKSGATAHAQQHSDQDDDPFF